MQLQKNLVLFSERKLTNSLRSLVKSHFLTKKKLQIEDIVVTDDDGKELSAKAGLLMWAQKHVEDEDMKVNNFHTCWKDGKVFNAIINRHR